MPKRKRAPNKTRGLEGWPPSFYCYGCHNRRFTVSDVEQSYCDQCRAFVAELVERLSAAGKAVPEA